MAVKPMEPELRRASEATQMSPMGVPSDVEQFFPSDTPIMLVHGRARDALAAMPTASVDCAITSPPYWSVRRYDGGSILGEEETPQDYVRDWQPMKQTPIEVVDPMLDVSDE